MSAAAAAAAAAPHAGGGAAAEPDAEGRQYLETQRHAAAVQLHSRGLAIAHLRGQLAMPRGSALALPTDAAAAPRAKPQPSAAAARAGAAAVPAAAAPQQAIRISVDCTPERLAEAQGAGVLGQPPPPPQQPQQVAVAGSRHVPLKPRPLVHRQPDAVAAARFLADELPLEAAAGDDAGAGDDGAATAGAGAAAPAAPGFAPRIAADPALLGQQLAGWVRITGEAGNEGGSGVADGGEDEELQGPGLAAAVDEADLMDEEEWI